ncbi:MAG: hypothetical protein AAF434_05730 [Pseudomonadota bacterium]
MANALFAIGLVLLSQTATAHSSFITTYLLKHDQAGWRLIVSAPLHPVHSVLVALHGEEAVVAENGSYNVELANQYFESKIEIVSSENVRLELEHQKTQLGNHQRDFVYTIKNMPLILTRLDFSINALAENIGQHNVVRVISKKSQSKLVLKQKNDFRGSLHFTGFE